MSTRRTPGDDNYFNAHDPIRALIRSARDSRGLSLAPRLLVLAALLASGCGKNPARTESSLEGGSPAIASGPARRYEPAPERVIDGKVVLGSERLTAGIPGEGPLRLAEVRAWLDDPQNHEPLKFLLPRSLLDAQEQIAVPSDNPLTRAKIELGRQLFFDHRLGGPEKGTSCGDCHPPRDHFTDPGIGLDPSIRHARSAPVPLNRILSTLQFWDVRAASLEAQALMPLFDPHEMANTAENCVATLQRIEGYRLQFERIFGGVSLPAAAKAIASFERALVTGPAPYDYERQRKKWEGRDPAALSEAERAARERDLSDATSFPMSEAAKRGEALFFSARTGCSQCHSGANFTDEKFHNLGVGMNARYPDLGRYESTHDEADIGAFKTPTLRNVSQTAPYMHRGQLATLAAVVDWYAKGGFANPHLSPQIKALDLTAEEKQDLVAFLQSLSGPLPAVETGRLPE